VLFLLFIGSLSLRSVHAQSNEELLQIIKQMREQIEAQQKQLQRMEQELRQRVKEQGPTEAQAAVPVGPAAPHASVSSREIVNDWYLAGFVGGAFPLQTNAVTTRTNVFFASINDGKDIPINASPLVGAKAGLCLDYFPNLCSEAEFDYFRPKIDEQFARGTTTGPGGVAEGAGVPDVDLTVYNLGLSAIGRVGFLEAAGYPLKKRLHLYLGGGPSFVWTAAHSGSTPTGGANDRNFVVGFHALAGLKYFITEKFAVFGEYKFKHWAPKAFSLGTDHFDVSSFNANLFYIGLAFHP
jgi:opacity protein-like surface antigen